MKKVFNKFLIIVAIALLTHHGIKYFPNPGPKNIVNIVQAQEKNEEDTNKEISENQKLVKIEVFTSSGCPHCRQEKIFLMELAEWRDDVIIQEYEVSQSREGALKMQEYGKKLGVNISGVPFTVINGEYYVSGFRTRETTGLEIINIVREIQKEEPLKNLDELNQENKTPENNFNFLFLKNIDLEKLSLPLLTFVIALADGFNPCAMWVLLFLISLLIKMENKRRRWIIGGTFIFVSGMVYFLFLTAWLKFFQLLSYISWIRFAIGALALTAAFIYIRDVIKNPSGCKVVGDNQKRRRIFEKLREYALKDNLWIALGGISLLAIAVNFVELLCSAGLPATYTNLLAMNNLHPLTYYLYLLFYVVIFMIDDFTVFAIAMITLQATGLENKYARIAHLVGGLVMLFIGLSMIFKPELLMFG